MSSISEIVMSFTDNIKDKSKNPFFGTYITIWIIRNWEIVFCIFNFDDNYTLDSKIGFIKTHFNKQPFINNLLENVGLTIVILIVSYFLINLSRYIINLYEKKLTPWVYKITDSSSIVLKSDLVDIETQRYELQTLLDQERESKARIESRSKKTIEDILTENKKAVEDMTKFYVNERELQVGKMKTLYEEQVTDYLAVISKLKKEKEILENEKINFISERKDFQALLKELQALPDEQNLTDTNTKISTKEIEFAITRLKIGLSTSKFIDIARRIQINLPTNAVDHHLELLRSLNLIDYNKAEHTLQPYLTSLGQATLRVLINQQTL